MSFKWVSSSFRSFVIVAWLSGSGCSLYEGPPPPKKKEFQTLACLKNFGPGITDYFDGKSNVTTINAMANCSVSAIRAFREVVRGENRDRFTALEVRNFLQRYFLEDIQIPDALLREFMRVKQAAVGGAASEFSSRDLEAAEGVIEAFRAAAVRLLPVLPLSIERVTHAEERYVDDASSALIEATQILGTKIPEIDSPYRFEEMERLFDALAGFLPTRATTFRAAAENLKTAGVIKEFLLSSRNSRESVNGSEWKTLVVDGARAWGIYSKLLNMGARYPDFTRGSGRDRFAKISKEAIDFLEQVSLRHEESGRPAGIPIALIQELMEASAWKGDVAGVAFKKATLEKILPPLIRRFLGGGDSTETGRAATRLTPKHLQRLRVALQEWVDGSRYVEGVFAAIKNSPNFPDATEVATSAILAFSAGQILAGTGEISEASLRVAENLRSNLGNTVSLAPGISKMAIFDGSNRKRTRSYAECARYAWLRAVLRLGIIGYEKGKEPLANERPRGLDLEEFTTLVRDYWQVLLDFQFVGPSNNPTDDSQRRMRESALFTQSSDGDGLITVEEGVQLVLIMLSVDPMNRHAHGTTEKECKTGDRDEWGYLKIEPYCYRKTFYDFTSGNKKYSEITNSFPLLVRFYESLDSERRAEFIRYIETVSRKKGYQETAYFDSSDTQAAVTLLHYVESIFMRFDANSDGKINEKEAETAFPVFQGTLAAIAKLDADSSRVRKVFYWLLAKGSPPITDDMGYLRKFWHGIGFMLWGWRGPDFEADRLGLLKVFAALASSPGNAPPPSRP